MNHEHLSDDQIQEILDAPLLKSGQILSMHLGTCASCQKRLESFQQLYASLAADPGFVLPPVFADSVLDKIPVSRPVFWARPAVRISLAISALTLVLAGLFVFVDMKPLAGQATRMANSLADAFRPLLAQFQHLFAKLHGSAGVFMLGGLGLLSAAFFDHILKQQTLHRSR